MCKAPCKYLQGAFYVLWRCKYLQRAMESKTARSKTGHKETMQMREIFKALKVLMLSALALTITSSAARAALVQRGAQIELSGASYFVALNAANGDIERVSSAAQKTSLWQSGENGFWHARFQDGTLITAHDCQMTSAIDAARGTLRLEFVHPRLKVEVVAQSGARGVDFSARLTPQKSEKPNTLLDFALPARLRFAPTQMQRLVIPARNHDATGIALKAPFFSAQPAAHPTGWQHEGGSGAAYNVVWGGPLVQRPDGDAPALLKVTSTGRQWLGEPLAAALEKTPRLVNRPSTRAQVDVILVDSANGPYFAGSALNGKANPQGLLWRVGGGVDAEAAPNVAAMVAATANHVAATTKRRKIGLLALANGPQNGGWASVALDEWRARLQNLPVVRAGKAQFVEIASTQQMAEALSDDWAAIVNPYGEWLPTLQNSTTTATAQRIAAWVRGGGHWFETGGYSFYAALKPQLHFSYGADYPGSFADFFHLDGNNQSASLYGVQPQNSQPREFVNAKADDSIFVPLRWNVGSDERGGFLDRHFATWVVVGQSWQSPLVRLTVGGSAFEQARQYARDNNFTRRLPDKMAPELLNKWKRSVLVKYSGNAAEKLDNLALLPVPTQIHFSDYLHGGFDKQLPDHLPPNANFGSSEQLKTLFERGHAMGHLLVPYTNPTWWCDHPRGPTFLRAGDKALAVGMDGKPIYEKYGANDGWTVTFWQPDVRAVNQKIRAQFVQDLGVDVLFQDQVGARGWIYDFNPTSPTPYAYSEGLLRQASEDASVHPLSTEDGWDRVINWEAQFCGLSFGTVPSQNSPAWSSLLSERWPSNCWELFPLAQVLAHDKVAFLHHDLGQFVTDPQSLAWSLALGYNMSYDVSAPELKNDATRHWLLWLDRIQKSVCARSTGQGIVDFTHDATAQKISATYGDVHISADLRPGQSQFVARAPGLLAMDSERTSNNDAAFVAQSTARGGDLWIYAPESTPVRLTLPAPFAGAGTLRFDGGTAQNFTAPDNVVNLQTPARADAQVVKIPVALANVAPRAWPLAAGEKRRIGVIDFGKAVGWNWSEISPAMWREALQNSQLAKRDGVEIETLSTPQQVLAALESGREKYFAIINSHTETIPENARGTWPQTLDAIRAYVQNGGQWWETGAASFYNATWRDDNGTWQRENIGPAGMAQLGLPMGGGEIAQTAQTLRAGRDAEVWLGATAATIAQQSSVVNRGLPRGDADHIALVGGRDADFIGGYRLNGWGVLWRIGGFYPNPQVAIPTVVASLENGYQRPPLPIRSGTKYLWHARFESASTDP